MAGNVKSRCGQCGGTYGGNAGHCKGCHQTFSSDSAFDRHLISRVTAGCHDPATVVDKQDRPVLVYDEGRELWKMADHTGGARFAGFRLHEGQTAPQAPSGHSGPPGAV